MKNAKQIDKLLVASHKLFNLANESNRKKDSMLRFNIETAKPNDITEFTDEEIEFQDKVTKRIMYSFQKTIMQIAELSND